MTRREPGKLTDRVVDVVRASASWCSVRDVHAELGREAPIAYTTVLTVLQRLVRHGVLEHERAGRAGRYRIAEQVDPRGARTLVDQAVGRFGAVAVAQFVERTREDPELLAELRRQLGMDEVRDA